MAFSSPVLLPKEVCADVILVFLLSKDISRGMPYWTSLHTAHIRASFVFLSFCLSVAYLTTIFSVLLPVLRI